VVCFSLIGNSSCADTSDDVSETQAPAVATATTGSGPDPTVTTGLEPVSYDGGGVGGSIVEADVFESLLAIPPAADVCRQKTLPVDAVLPVVIVRVSCEFIPDDRITPFSIDVDYPLMEGPHAASINGEVRATVKDLLTKFLDSALHNSAYLVEVGLPYEAPFRLTGGVTLANERLYSVELPLWYYVPTAAHGDNAVRNFTFDLETGKRVLLADLFLPDSDWTTTLEASLEVALRDSKTSGTIQHLCTLGSGPWEYEDSVYADTFNVTEDALRIYHWLAPYACRVEPFDIPYTDLVDVVDPDGPLQPCEVAQRAALVATCGSDISEAVFDVANSTFDVRCPGILGGGAYPRLTTFVDGVADPPYVGGNGYIRVREEAVVELVEESPGPEVIARIGCSGGGTGTSTELQVFAGNNEEAKRLGQILEHRYLDSTSAAHWGLGSHFVARRYEYQTGDTNNQQSKFTSLVYRWKDGGWAETVHEAWVRETQPDIDPDVALAGIELDVANATLDLDCWMAFGSTTFIDGEWINQADFLNRAWVTKWEVVELVEESPGPEVATEIACSSGGSHTQFEVHVYAGNSDEPRRLGRILGELLHGVQEFNNRFVTKVRIWRDGDAHCCPSQYELIWYEWQDSDWVETDSEIWGRGPDAEPSA